MNTEEAGKLAASRYLPPLTDPAVESFPRRKTSGRQEQKGRK